MNPILVHPEPRIFPGNPSNEFSECGNMADSGFFGIGFAFPRVSLHHSCAACVIVAAPGVIISAAPIGAMFCPHQLPLRQVFGFCCLILAQATCTERSRTYPLVPPIDPGERLNKYCRYMTTKIPAGMADIITPDK